jgi:hypothetical protein
LVVRQTILVWLKRLVFKSSLPSMPPNVGRRLVQKKPAQPTGKPCKNGERQYTHFTQTEVELATQWRKAGKSLSVCAGLLGRSAEAVRENTTPSLVRKKAMKVKGRPALISDAKFQKILKTAENMIEVADCRWEVTIDMIKRKVQFSGSLRTLADAFRKRGYYFRKFREKLRLTPQDVIDREQFASDFESVTGERWKKTPHGIIDNKSYPLYRAALQQLLVDCPTLFIMCPAGFGMHPQSHLVRDLLLTVHGI